MGGLKALFNPESIAVIGASKDPKKLGHVLLKNVLDYGFKGGIYPVNPREKAILERKTYSSMSAVPAQVDLALISIPSHLVLDVIEECGSCGVKSAIVLASGFGEAGTAGREIEQKIQAIVRSSGMRVVGPNCMGIYNLPGGLNGTYFWELPRFQGDISFVSQSGAYGGILFSEIRQRKIGISKFLSIGNMVDIDHCDVMRYLADDDETKVIAIFVEGLRDGRAFIELAIEVSQRKPIVAFKAGRTNAGLRAAESHTGSLAGSIETYEAAFKQSGVILARDTEQFFDVSMALSSWSDCLPESNDVAILTISGGPCVTAGDLCEEIGLTVPNLDDALRAEIRRHIPFFGADSNPVDMTPQMNPANYEGCVDLVFSQPKIGGVIAMNVGLDQEEFAAAFVKASRKYSKPVVSFTIDTPKLSQIFHDAHIPIYPSPERSVHAYDGLVKYGRYLDRLKKRSPERAAGVRSKILKQPREEGRRPVLGNEASSVLREYGIPVVPEEVVRDMEEAARGADRIGYPVVLKVLSSGVLHKSDSGGVRLDLENETMLRDAWNCLNTEFGSASSFLLQPMIKGGVEVIVGGKRDPTFGPVILFGLGGILTELLKDFSIRICPINQEDAREMVEETRGYEILKGYRGRPPCDMEAIAAVLLKTSDLLISNPQISQLDINPLIVQEKGALAVDALIILET